MDANCAFSSRRTPFSRSSPQIYPAIAGDAVNPDATVVQLISFDGGDTVNLVRGCGELKLLDKSMRPLNPGYCLRLRHDCQNKGI